MEHNLHHHHHQPSEQTPLLPKYTPARDDNNPPRSPFRLVHAALLFTLLFAVFTPLYLFLLRPLSSCTTAIPPAPPHLFSRTTTADLRFVPLHVSDAALNSSHFPDKRLTGRIVILPPLNTKDHDLYFSLATVVRISSTAPDDTSRVVPQVVTGDNAKWLELRSHDTPPPSDSTTSPYITSIDTTTPSCASCTGHGGMDAREVWVDVYLRPATGYSGAILIHATTLAVEMAPCGEGELKKGKGGVEWVWTLSPNRRPVAPAATMK
ncbi:hypothetical protein Dda_7898 [Drechslerella dactyloides]|uniref:Uncharacterized protein n=1 Tax=Drechslerella dactyloides TaxID=74499 RepID=A0AAD6IR53_DREDA|nr:hypothetical protein Dda_7898 [Drechslerella dactyloides]